MNNILTVGPLARSHIELKCNRLGQLEAQVLGADGTLRAEVPVGLVPGGYDLGNARIWDKRNSGNWAHAVVFRVLSIKRARAAYADLGCTA